MQAKCRICGNHTAEETSGSVAGFLTLAQKCDNCGSWTCALDLVAPDLSNPKNKHLLPYLAAHIRQTNQANGGKPVTLTPEWVEMAQSLARTSIPRRLDLLLHLFEDRTRYAGFWIAADPLMAPLVNAQNSNELDYLADTLVTQGLLERGAGTGPPRYRISAAGWDHLHPAAAGGVPGTAFAAMWFDDSLDDAFQRGMLPAIQACGFDVNRVDRTAHNDQITDRIVAGIRSAQFVVAGFTGQRQSVYYEAGLAQGIGKTVIRTCRENEIRDLHFDTRQFFHLAWVDTSDLREKLEDHVKATIGTWPPRR